MSKPTVKFNAAHYHQKPLGLHSASSRVYIFTINLRKFNPNIFFLSLPSKETFQPKYVHIRFKAFTMTACSNHVTL
jgi:hypothetical protein